MTVGGPSPLELKFGLFDSQAERTYRERILQYNTPGVYSGDPNQVLASDNLGALTPPVTNGNTVTYTWNSFIQSPSDRSFYTAESDIPAAYAMLEIPVLESVRLIGGVRFEGTEIKTTSFTTVPSEGVVPGTTNSPPPLDQTDLLPSLGLIWSISPTIHLRLNYGETVARPSFRELAGVRTYDPVLDEFIVGNTNLQVTQIKNYDARIEWFPRPGELLSAGLFYKDLKNVIEKEFTSGTGDIVTFVNRPEAQVYGLELEARKSLDFLSFYFRQWTLGGNVSLIESEQEVSDLQRQNHTRPDLLDDSRPLADQSPYIINLDLTYDNPYWGSTLSLNYNVFGPRLIIANLTAPDIYEQPVQQLDLVLSQRIARGLRLKFAARNLLDPTIERTYGKDSQAVYSSYTRGRSFSLSMNWEF
jgi:TonB-dependent receptor